MKRCLSILLVVLVCGLANAQTLKKGKNDLEKNNLKGNVVSVTEYSCAVKEAFGEWERGIRYPSQMSVFNEKGNYILYTEDPILLSNSTFTDYITDIGRVPVIGTVQLYYYDEAGKLLFINCVYEPHPLSDTENIVDWFFKAYQNEFIVKTFAYNPDGTIKSITSDRKISHYSEESLGICAKEVFKYDSDGPEIWFYKMDGSRDTDKNYKILTKDKCIIKQGDNGVGIEMYNDKGQVIARQRNATLINGQFKGDVYYDYNEHGDLRAVANNVQAIGAIKGYESLYPYIGDRINQNTVCYYGYDYDSHGNWIVRKEYSIRGNEVIVSGWKERDIQYAGEGLSGEEIVSNLIDDVNGQVQQKRSEQEARDEYYARPYYPELTDEFFEWLKSTVTYPGEGTPLGSILAAYGSSLKIRLPLEFTPEGTFTPPTSYELDGYYTSEGAITWDFRNNKTYIFQTTAEREEKQAQEQINQIMDKLLVDLKNAPAITKGQESKKISVTIVFEKGEIRVGEGY